MVRHRSPSPIVERPIRLTISAVGRSVGAILPDVHRAFALATTHAEDLANAGGQCAPARINI
jgi:hypothetical protein